jgi:predicted aspartyl protease
LDSTLATSLLIRVLRSSDPGTPILAGRELDALIDTGAAESCIDGNLAQALKLPHIDRDERLGAFGAKEVDIYLAQLHIPELEMTIYGRFAAVAPPN